LKSSPYPTTNSLGHCTATRKGKANGGRAEYGWVFR
jgi:hypothetical protein